jgi:hypothetical protein
VTIEPGLDAWTARDEPVSSWASQGASASRGAWPSHWLAHAPLRNRVHGEGPRSTLVYLLIHGPHRFGPCGVRPQRRRSVANGDCQPLRCGGYDWQVDHPAGQAHLGVLQCVDCGLVERDSDRSATS